MRGIDQQHSSLPHGNHHLRAPRYDAVHYSPYWHRHNQPDGDCHQYHLATNLPLTKIEDIMKHRYDTTERGQALIIIVFAMVGLIGITALTVDGGYAFSDHRHAQNAADTAVLAGARAIIRGEDWKSAALAIAAQNNYI